MWSQRELASRLFCNNSLINYGICLSAALVGAIGTHRALVGYASDRVDSIGRTLIYAVAGATIAMDALDPANGARFVCRCIARL